MTPPRLVRGLAFLALVGPLFVGGGGGFAEAVKNEYITCGSVISLQGETQRTQLACKEVAYGGRGSGQNACTGVTGSAEPDRYFVVRGLAGEDAEPCLQGTLITKGRKLRLQHMASGRWLHSHHITSMISNNQEVSCFGGADESDDSDVWHVTWNGGGKYWAKSDKVTFKHDVTGRYLGAMGGVYPKPLAGQKEVAALKSKSAATLFTVTEGIIFPQRVIQNTASPEDKVVGA
eukprot:CAMPEP_0197490262 /NCGR_PEP_ID=MMETSP1311-20131121/4846_1 /TAXON_ID=464262 /ORGANISM="Genus nov. species nov., Strain RCC856" /LENGTH=232 /DNA_ID=CAMNT_0043034747 /DNA_START=92 /DNA_END=786 /DNA_ORIENTATION=+